MNWEPWRPSSPLGHRGGMGERFTAASRPGSGQWVAMTSALEFCRTQPSVCSHTASKAPWPEGPRRKLWLSFHHTLCPRTTARLTELSRTFNYTKDSVLSITCWQSCNNGWEHILPCYKHNLEKKNVYTCITESLCCTIEPNSIVNQLYFNF